MERLTPDQWGAANRVYPATSGRPGRRDPTVTPYTIEFERDFARVGYTRAVFVTSAQTGKTESILDVIGHKLDTSPTPILYVGPSKDFNTDQFEPRLMGLFDEAPKLARKLDRGKRMKKTLKRVAGVPLRLAHAGSSTALKSDPAGLALVDEYDEMMANIRGQGDPLGLVEARGDTYADFKTGVTSTPSLGSVKTEIDPVSKLEFWAVGDPEEIQSPVWKLWQEGTRHHWAWKCPHCDEWFIPRFKLLSWPKGATPSQALKDSWLECPSNGCVIVDDDKEGMNANGAYIAPNQWFDENDIVQGDPPETTTLSRWVSGLASPFRTFGQRAERYLKAKQSGEPDKEQAAINAGFGECFSEGSGDLPAVDELLALRVPLPPMTVPDEALFLTLGADVQKNRIVYAVRAWGARASSWLIDYGELWGDTALEEVWDDFSLFIRSDFSGLPIRLGFVDSGFRPGKKTAVPVNRVYEFCRRHGSFVFPTKGRATQAKPIIISKIDVQESGKISKYGLSLHLLDSDYWKRWVHERLRYPLDSAGAWRLHEETTKEYAEQILSEVRTISPTGAPVWVQLSKDNHYLDAEALAAAAGYKLNAQKLPIGARRRETAEASRGPTSLLNRPKDGDGSAPAKRGSLARRASRMNG